MKRLAFVLILLLLLGCSQAATPESVTLFAMDTSVVLTCYGEDAAACLDACSQRLYELDYSLDYHEGSGPLNALNEAFGQWCVLDADSFSALSLALEYARLTDGAFDPTIGSILSAWDDFSGETVPDEDARLQAAALCDYTAVELDFDTMSARLKEGQRIALGGIGKGYAADCLAEIYRSYGCTGTINLGGNVYAVGRKNGSSAWKIGIKSPFDSSLIRSVEIFDCSVVTSGSYERNFTYDGVFYHHIFDPETGSPAKSDLVSVSIVCESSALADALSTAVFVMGFEKGSAFLYENNISAVLIQADGTVTEVLIEAF
ncbi:MAG: FAD:protein FMN transferase [Clostridia bacterium]|nr:FAD:protein FMN transferase [Clostridia bacterium]